MSVNNNSSFENARFNDVHQSTASKQRSRDHNYNHDHDHHNSILPSQSKQREDLALYDGECNVHQLNKQETNWIKANLSTLRNLDNYKHISYTIIPGNHSYTIFYNKKSAVGQLPVTTQRIQALVDDIFEMYDTREVVVKTKQKNKDKKEKNKKDKQNKINSIVKANKPKREERLAYSVHQREKQQNAIQNAKKTFARKQLQQQQQQLLEQKEKAEEESRKRQGEQLKEQRQQQQPHQQQQQQHWQEQPHQHNHRLNTQSFGLFEGTYGSQSRNKSQTDTRQIPKRLEMGKFNTGGGVGGGCSRQTIKTRKMENELLYDRRAAEKERLLQAQREELNRKNERNHLKTEMKASNLVIQANGISNQFNSMFQDASLLFDRNEDADDADDADDDDDDDACVDMCEFCQQAESVQTLKFGGGKVIYVVLDVTKRCLTLRKDQNHPKNEKIVLQHQWQVIIIPIVIVVVIAMEQEIECVYLMSNSLKNGC